jgi:hypothetical protein
MTETLGERAYAHVYHLAAEIGPRPAGSEAERRAFAYIEAQLRACGLTTQITPVPFAPPPRFFAVFALGGAALLAGGLALAAVPWLAVLAPLVILPLPDIARAVIRRRPRTAQSQNLIAYTSADETAPTLILCAHVDSAPASVFGSRWLLALHQHLMFIALRVGWALATTAILLLLGFALPAPVTQLVGGAAIVTGGVWALMEALNQLMRQRWSPGAHDNASGVGVVLALAEHFAQHPPERQRLGFLFTGAEETGLHGAEAFAALHRSVGEVRSASPVAGGASAAHHRSVGEVRSASPVAGGAGAAHHRSVGEVRSASPVAGGAGAAQPGLRGQRVAILNLDMVGAGDRLTYVLQDGALRVHATDAALNQLVRAADPEARGILNTLRSGDYLPFLRRGLATASLETRGARDAELAYHTVRDTVEVIDIARLGATAQTVIEVVATAEARGYPERKV